ncbi:MAG: hypothetical protein PHC48_02700 [Prevotella sp.]|nr:hypothetical protein [Prevotella sp.]
MAAKSRKSKLNFEELTQSALGYAQKNTKFKKIQAQFTELKEKFYADMEDYFDCNDIDPNEGVTIECDNELVYSGTLTVKKVQKSSVEFDANKLEKALGKEFSQDVITKKHEITDMIGLVAYLKECGCDPKIFKSFIQTSKVIDTKELDRLEEIGKITIDQVAGCYEIKHQKPYFTVNVKKGKGDKD